MALFPTLSEIKNKYFTYLKSIKPSININDKNSDFVIRGTVFSGMLSGQYADQAKVDNDSWVSTCRPEALVNHGADMGIDASAATKAKSTGIKITGTNGKTIAIGDLTFIYAATNVLYTNTTAGTIENGELLLSIQAEVTGQIGNVSQGETLKIVSPPSGVGSSASVEIAIADGSDIESTDSYRARLLARKQNTPAGGNETDYPVWATEASDAVRSVLIKRFGRGLGTVDIYITSGTTDIDTAVTQGQSIVRIPSSSLIETVQAYYDSHAPTTDSARVFAPSETTCDVSVKVALASGLTLSSIPSDATYNPLNLTVEEIIKREIKRVLYKNPIGGRVPSGTTQGYIFASDVEEGLDKWLSAVKDPITGLYKGLLPILTDRQVLPLNGTEYNKPVTSSQLASPGTLSVILGV